jgi:PAS domain S-box-containing protein
MIDLSPDPVIIADKAGIIIYCNEVFCVMTMYEKHELIGFPISSTVMPDELVDMHEGFVTSYVNGKDDFYTIFFCTSG